jgi:hypothetical protein
VRNVGAKLIAASIVALTGIAALPSQASAYALVETATENYPSYPAPLADKSDPDQMGYGPSEYTGKFYREVDEHYRRCVAQREGRFQYWVTGNNGFYESTFQMTDALVRGASWMIQPELKSMFGARAGKKIALTLRNSPGHKWDRFYMDMAFWTILNWNGPRSGAFHWAGGRFTCTPGMSDYGGDR